MINTNENIENTNPIKNNKGVTIFELLVAIIVGSVVITMLMQQLVMTVEIRRNFELENRMLNESYYIAEQIKFNIFNVQPHSVQVIEDSSTQTVIQIRHEYDITANVDNVIERDCSSPVTDLLVYDKINQKLTYNGQDFHSSNVKIVFDAGNFESSISVIELDPVGCAASPPPGSFCDSGFTEDDAVCYQGIIKLELYLQIDGINQSEPQLYVSTIIV